MEPLAFPSPHPLPPQWQVTRLTAYDDAHAEMEARAAAIRANTAGEMVWLLEHAPVYTAGRSARPEDLINPAVPMCVRQTAVVSGHGTAPASVLPM